MENQGMMKDALTLTQWYGVLDGGSGYIHTKFFELLSEEQQKAFLNSIDTSYAIIEQQENNCVIIDYWSKTEESKMLKLKRVEIKKPIWKFW